MRTIVVISTRGFGAFRHDLLRESDSVRFIGIFSEHDAGNVTQSQRDYLTQVHIVPCGKPNPTVAESSLVDLDTVRELISSLLHESGPGELSLHSFDERNLLLTAELRAHFGLPGPTYDDILPFRDKCLMKEKLLAAGVRVPAFGRYDVEAATADPARYFRAISEEVGLPLILKPVDGNSADGVVKVGSFEEYAALPVELGRPYEYEEFIDGTMYSVNIISKDRRTVFGGVTEYLVNSTEVQNGRVNVDINLIDSDPRVARMIAFAESALAALGWPDGASHLELFRTAEDELVFLEVAARFKGMAGVLAMQRNYGVALLNLAFEIEAGVPSRPFDGEQVYCFDGVVPKQSGVIDSLIDPDIESEFEMAWTVRPGEEIGQGESLSDNGGTFLVWNKDYEALYRDFERFAHYRPITYRATDNAKVLGIQPADPAAALAYFYGKLRCETDPFDVQHDLAAGVDGFVILDTRRSAAFNAEHIPGARNVSHHDMTAETLADLDSDLVYITYGWGPGCNGGTRGAAKLAERGFRVKEMIGGIEYWKRLGYPTRSTGRA